MKRCFFAGLFLQVLMSAAYAQEETLERFFRSRIQGGETCSMPDGRFSPEAIAEKRALVWEVWKRVNASLEEERLIDLSPLDDAKSGVWPIPESLEPKAELSYYWGSKGEMPEDGAPFYLYLHGSGPRNQEWTTGLRLAQKFQDAPSVYFIPRIPNEGEYYRWWQRGKQYVWDKLLRQVMLRTDIDVDRLYVFGISEGGYGSQRLASFYADYWAAAGPMAGGEPLKNAPAENLRNVAFSLRTGAKDYGFYRDVLTGYTKNELDSLSGKFPGHFPHWVELIPGYGHGIDYAPTTPWLAKHRRNPWPSVVSWEDFEMDGLHRRGFYNIEVKERASDSLRTRYDVEVKDNCVDVKVTDVRYEVAQRDSVWGIEMKFNKKYTPSIRGRFVIYLDEHLVDLRKKVTLKVNGHVAYHGKVKCSLKNMAQSLSVFYDPRRIFPAALQVDLSKVGK